MKTNVKARATVARFLFGLLFLFVLDSIAVQSYYHLARSTVNTMSIPESSDAGIVFFGSFGPYEGLSAQSAARVQHAANLYHEGKIQYIIAVGGLRENRERSGAALLVDALVKKGVSSDAVSLGAGSYDSQTNWKEAFDVIKANGWKSVVLISSNLHLYRLKGIVHDDTLAIYFSPHPYDSGNLLEQAKKVHHEWLAHLATALLPEQTYQSLLNVLRKRFELI